jgi:hypothetical protein
MASRGIDALTTRGTHNVGSLNSLKVKTLANGALVDEADGIDNFTAVELGFNDDGERTCSILTDRTSKTYIIATVERRLEGEELVDFYNADGERARIIIPESGYTRFESSNYSLNDGVTAVAKGQLAHWDVASGKWLISAADAAHADYATANLQLLVVNSEDNLEYCNGKALVRFEVI